MILKKIITKRLIIRLLPIMLLLITSIFVINSLNKYYIRYNLLEHMKNGMDDPVIVDVYKKDITDVSSIANAPIVIRYFDVDLDNNGLDDKVVILRSPLHSGSQGDMFTILINDGDSFTEALCMSIRLYSQDFIPTGDVYVLKSKNNGFRNLEIRTGESKFVLMYENGKYQYVK